MRRPGEGRDGWRVRSRYSARMCLGAVMSSDLSCTIASVRDFSALRRAAWIRRIASMFPVPVLAVMVFVAARAMCAAAYASISSDFPASAGSAGKSGLPR